MKYLDPLLNEIDVEHSDLAHTVIKKAITRADIQMSAEVSISYHFFKCVYFSLERINCNPA